MRRRQVLAAVPVALAGCVAAPEPGPPTGSPPNVFLDVDRHTEGFELRFAYGSPVTDDNTDRLYVTDDAARTETPWVGGDGAPASFPLEPGAELSVDADPSTEHRLVWVALDGDRSVSLAQFGGEDE
ncbi:uncharacterized protein NP_1480A [Natronomonas pharaonis DSM 2160]|uniref:Secreted glycoprotein n=1 Tax=Natronomonas pharaonis (strain ATCC 35678 / DSM 2160 / CIP 103997 / JCM 8858 / NBRC 14720 / NCIMB 2260 / Gabara) TaxID=348780 RepID=A0A1U7EV19_NATPD|nr:hypothetical protein [Natronomonas pharaonis]CAI48831.1 uncharacterized protein NP_1480A [Natronomonas pharaonis DSM 2160]